MMVLLDLVTEDQESHRKDTAARKSAVDFMSRAVARTSAVAPFILLTAWRWGEVALFKGTVRAGFKNGVPEAGVVDALVKTVKERHFKIAPGLGSEVSK